MTKFILIDNIKKKRIGYRQLNFAAILTNNNVCTIRVAVSSGFRNRAVKHFLIADGLNARIVKIFICDLSKSLLSFWWAPFLVMFYTLINLSWRQVNQKNGQTKQNIINICLVFSLLAVLTVCFSENLFWWIGWGYSCHQTTYLNAGLS